MRRRGFILALGGAAAWPVVARAQPAERTRRVSVLMTYAERDPEAQLRVVALREGLQKLGWIEGGNLQTHYSYVTDLNTIPKHAADLVQRQPDVILVNSNLGTAALLKETHAIPIVFVLITDPVGDGFVESLSRPNRNATGFTNYEFSMGGKWLELLKQVAPQTVRVAVVMHQETKANVEIFRAAVSAAAVLQIELEPFPVHDAAEIEAAFAKFAGPARSGVLVVPHPLTLINRELLGHLSVRYALPAVFANASFAKAGGLISYGIGAPEAFRQAASYVDRILKGAKPADLPVQQPTAFELVINLRTAKTLGLEIPPTLLARADEVIE